MVTLVIKALQVVWWHTGRVLDFQSRSHAIDLQSGCYRVVTTWVGDCLWTGKPSRYTLCSEKKHSHFLLYLCENVQFSTKFSGNV